MKIDATISADLSTVARSARQYEALGYDGLRVAELNHDPFLALTLAAEHTDRGGIDHLGGRCLRTQPDEHGPTGARPECL